MGCKTGLIYLGFEGEDGEEHYETLPCRRCAEEAW
jgi:hypothetical protein